jgi:hypothetical protein
MGLFIVGLIVGLLVAGLVVVYALCWAARVGDKGNASILDRMEADCHPKVIGKEQ